jgi:hypothetical protein
VWGVLVGGRRVNGGDEGDMVNGLHTHVKWNNETSYNFINGGSNLANVQCKAIWNCHNESSLYNEYVLIKMKKNFFKEKLVLDKKKRLITLSFEVNLCENSDFSFC